MQSPDRHPMVAREVPELLDVAVIDGDHRLSVVDFTHDWNEDSRHVLQKRNTGRTTPRIATEALTVSDSALLLDVAV